MGHEKEDPRFAEQSEYERFTERLDHYPSKIENAQILFHALGLVGEAGEVANKVKKIFRDHDGVLTPEMAKTIEKELGGVYWYFTRLTMDIGSTMEDIRHQNMEILKSREQRGTLKGSGDDR